MTKPSERKQNTGKCNRLSSEMPSEWDEEPEKIQGPIRRAALIRHLWAAASSTGQGPGFQAHLMEPDGGEAAGTAALLMRPRVGSTQEEEPSSDCRLSSISPLSLCDAHVSSVNTWGGHGFQIVSVDLSLVVRGLTWLLAGVVFDSRPRSTWNEPLFLSAASPRLEMRTFILLGGKQAKAGPSSSFVGHGGSRRQRSL